MEGELPWREEDGGEGLSGGGDFYNVETIENDCAL